MADQKLFHMVPASTWTACVAAGSPYFPATYEQDGFTHLTGDPALLLTVANHFYTESPGDWVVLVLDGAKLTAEVKWEPAAPVGEKSSGELLKGAAAAAGAQDEQQQQQQQQQPAEPLFPHLYGAIDFAAVERLVPMTRAADGTFTGIPGLC